ncbi:MAG: hypothetical protein WCP92_08650 [bacterium]
MIARINVYIHQAITTRTTKAKTVKITFWKLALEYIAFMITKGKNKDIYVDTTITVK